MGAIVSVILVLLGIIVVGLSGLPGLLGARTSMIGQRGATALGVVGGALGLAGVGWFWATGDGEPLSLPTSLPGGMVRVAIDGLSAIFVAPVFVISALGGVYGLGYWRQTEHPRDGRKLRFFYGLMTAAMGLVVIAGDGVVFLIGWEIMALAAFFLVTTEDDQEEVRVAGWIYLAAAHVATLFLFGVFALLHSAGGTFAWVRLEPGGVSRPMATAIFTLALLGFGLKAGMMPLHIWLPSAHAIAPSHVSAMMSGVILKMGIYGLVRVTSLFSNPPVAWGVVVLALGAISGVLGVAFAIGQHDLKRLLAYHSIENIGIILMGLGLALIGRSLGRADWVVLGLAGALLHVWNHSLFKALLFLSAGSVVHATHTRAMDQLGGLSRTMPWTALAFLTGAVAICGLPPLNGFVSEFLIYVGLFGTLGTGAGPSFLGASFAAPTLTLIGALAAACFAKAFGVVFLGKARTSRAVHAVESPATMLVPMFALVGCCAVIGLMPFLVAPALERGIAAWAPELAATTRLSALAPLGWISVMSLALLGLLVLASLALGSLVKLGTAATGPVWGCGYAAPTARMQYTASSFAATLVGMFRWVLLPRVKRSRDLPLFPGRAGYHGHVPDVVLDDVVLPAFRLGGWIFSWFRVFQQGNIQMYVFYIFLALVLLLLWR